jgi:hypothetical protein
MSALRCSDLARHDGLSPAGTAGSPKGFVLVPARGPWPRNAADLLGDDPRVGSWHRSGIRPQFVAPLRQDEDTPALVTFDRPAGPFAGFTSAGHDDRVVIICCHGVRDVCCGSKGTRLAAALAKHPPNTARVLRTSHLGGHRFAPTALVLPEGTMWAFADPELLVGIVDRTIPVEQAIGHYRGCAGFDSPEVQVADGGGLLLEGWDWLDQPRETFVVSRRDEGAEVEIHGPSRSYRALVGVRRFVPVAGCGEPVDPNDPPQPEYELRAIERLGA